MTSTARVLVVYQHLPHYRQDVFQALDDIPNREFVFAAGKSTRDPGIARMPHAALKHAQVLRNRWIGPFLWQHGLLALLREDWDHVVFLGDWAYASTWVGALRCRLRRVPVSFWTIGWHRRERGLRRMVRLTFYRLADQLLLYGDDARRIGIDFGYPASRMAVVHNSSSEPPTHLEEDDGRLQDLRQALAEVRAPAVGAVIRLTERKRLDVLLRAVAELNRTLQHPVSVLLAGEGPAADALRQLAESLDVRLHLVGPVYGRRALGLFYDRCLVTVVPSLAGLTTLQSLKHGRPVITHDDPEEQVPEYEAIRPGETGDLYRKGDLEDLQQKIRVWLEKVSASPEDVRAACIRSLETGWTPEASARLIVDALESSRTASGPGSP